MKSNHPPVRPRCTGLLGLFWLASAGAQPGLTALILDHPAPQKGAGFGGALVGVGDVSGDSVPDLLAGAPGQDVDGKAKQGQAFVFGADNNLLLTLRNLSPQEGAFFGLALAGVGDVSRDGVPDLLVGNPSQDVGGNEDQGQAFVFSGADGSLLRILNDPPPSSGFGVDVDFQQG